MPRDVNGNFTLVPGNPVISGTVIESSWANSTMADIAVALTDSLSRTGSGGMLVPLLFDDGTIANPGIGFVNQPGMGFHRAGASDLRIVMGGNSLVSVTPPLVTINTSLSVGDITSSGNIVADGHIDIGGAPSADRYINFGNNDYLSYNDTTNTFLLTADAGDPFTGVNNTTLQTGRLRLTETGDASPSSTLHAFQVGPTSGLNLIIDNNEVIVRNNGVINNLVLNEALTVHSSGNITSGGTFTGAGLNYNTAIAALQGDVSDLEDDVSDLLDKQITSSGTTKGSIRIPYSTTNAIQICWGSRSIGQNSSVIETFHTAFTQVYQAVISSSENNTGADACTIPSLNNTSCTLLNGAGATNTCRYIAIGRRAI